MLPNGTRYTVNDPGGNTAYQQFRERRRIYGMCKVDLLGFVTLKRNVDYVLILSFLMTLSPDRCAADE